jgi:aspartate-semialdehyde dehydrogenase
VEVKHETRWSLSYKSCCTGATGAVGQRFVQLLAHHPWFEVAALAASEHSAGKPYRQVCNWLLPAPMPPQMAAMVVQPLDPGALSGVSIAFSALPSDVAGGVEEDFAATGIVICSNAAAHRLDPDVPLLIPEVNPEHTALIPRQRARTGWPGFI